jgi:hypothetical protein
VAYDPRVARTYRLDPETARRIEALTTRLDAYASPLVDMLLTRALDEVEAGRWALERRPVKFTVEWH